MQKLKEMSLVMQQLKVNLTIPLPDDHVLVTKVELEELKKIQLTGVYWTMKDLEGRVGRKQDWIKENILYPSKFRNILDAEKGGFVFYPRCKGQTWSFQAVRMADFLDKNFNKIFNK